MSAAMQPMAVPDRTDRLLAVGVGRVSLKCVDEIVSARLGPGRVPGNESGPALCRQTAMYLAHGFGWSHVPIGRFYQRHHTTVWYAIQKIDALRHVKPEFSTLLEELKDAIVNKRSTAGIITLADIDVDPERLTDYDLDCLADLVAERLAARMGRNGSIRVRR